MSKTHVAVWLRISPFYDMLLHISNCSEPTSKMLRISEVWRIRQIKFQKQSKKCKHFIPFFEILLGSEQLQYFGLTVCKTKIILIGDGICLKL